MCRTTEFHGFKSGNDKPLEIRAFYVQLSGSNSSPKTFPESLTLIYLPSIKATELVVDGFKSIPDTAAFLLLHRVKTKVGEAVFMSRERVRASEGLRFEVYMGQKRLLKGLYKKDQKEGWTLNSSCGLEKEYVVGGLNTADVSVVVEGKVPLNARVAMVVRRKCSFGRVLEVIPEDNEGFVGDEELDGGCCCDRTKSGSAGRDMEMMEKDLEVVRWAVDLGFWVMCLGMGFLVSKATAKRLRRLGVF